MIVASAILRPPHLFIGHRHHDCIMNRALYGLPKAPHLEIQGFVDHNHRFYTRESARLHFIKSGQLPYRGKFIHARQLFSEDLY